MCNKYWVTVCEGEFVVHNTEAEAVAKARKIVGVNPSLKVVLLEAMAVFKSIEDPVVMETL
jgi:hypothetical protein